MRSTIATPLSKPRTTNLRTLGHRTAMLGACLAAFSTTGCLHGLHGYGKPGQQIPRRGDEIMVAGQLFHTGAPVVLWTDRDGYDAYRAECKFNPGETLPTGRNASKSPQRYDTLRKNVPEDVKDDVLAHGWQLKELQNYVDLFVLHYDVCGTSQRCFKVLQDMRGLSVHFMLDLDGTIYQTLDLKERAWHAGSANDRSVGVEIANIGAYSPDHAETLDKWYGKDAAGRTIVTLPENMGDGGVRTKDFVAYPSRNDAVVSEIQGRDLKQYDLTDAQYDSLIKLTATLCKVLPKIRCDYPRDENGALRTSILTDEELASFSGVLGHYHVSKQKVDPGPALDWDRLIDGARREMR
ncbi:MAG: N-acetylmuramoyl-L-alanine amidase [Phycisphaerales bacterium]|nr:N-acetylmuramoyl-L-alanine amidase [Phycisphaerales bacterium]